MKSFDAFNVAHILLSLGFKSNHLILYTIYSLISKFCQLQMDIK